MTALPLAAGGGAGPALPRLPDHLALPALVGSVLGLLAFTAAMVVTGDPVLASAAGLGCLVAALAFADPLLALLLFAGLEVSQTGEVLAGLGVPSPLVVTQALAVGALGVALVRGRLPLLPSPVLLGAVLLLASRALTVLTAYDPGQAFATVLSDAKDLLTLFVAYALLVLTRGTGALLRTSVLVLAALSALSGVQEYLLANSTEFLGLSQVNPPDVGASSFRHTGPIGDPNFWGRVLLIFLPFGLALALGSDRRGPRLLWWAASAALLLGVFLTQSRGAFLSAGAAVVVLLVLAGWQYARWLALTPLLVLLLLVLPFTGERLATLSDLGESSQGGGDLSLVLRLASQEAGLRMFAQNPWLGVGAGNYEQLTPRFESGLSFATVGELGKPIAPHNAYLEYAAEGGVLGILGFLALLGAMTWCAWRAWRTATRLGTPGERNPSRLLAAACLASLAGWGVASVVLHVRQFRTLLVLAAVIAALDVLRSRERAPARTPVRAPRALALPWAALVAVPVLGGLLLLGPASLHVQQWQANAVAVVAARGTSGFLDAYHYDLLTRGQLVPTLAGVVSSRSVLARSLQDSGQADGDVDVRVVTRPRSGDLLVQVDGDGPDQVRAVARQVATVGARAVDRLQTPFVLTPVPAEAVGVAQVERLRPSVVALAALWVVLALVLAWTHLQVLHRRRLRGGQQER